MGTLSPQFHHVPLYLEWAPIGIFSSTAPQEKVPQKAATQPTGEDEEEPEAGKSRVRAQSAEGCEGTHDAFLRPPVQPSGLSLMVY